MSVRKPISTRDIGLRRFRSPRSCAYLWPMFGSPSAKLTSSPEPGFDYSSLDCTGHKAKQEVDLDEHLADVRNGVLRRGDQSRANGPASANGDDQSKFSPDSTLTFTIINSIDFTNLKRLRSMSLNENDDTFAAQLERVTQHVLSRHKTLDMFDTLPPQSSISHTIQSLPPTLSAQGLGLARTTSYLLDNLVPGLLQGQPGPRYFGFVTGGVTESAQLADILTGSYDENVQMTLPGATASTAVEARTLELVLDLLGIERAQYTGRTITTGATASNVLGLACARDYLYSISPHLPQGYSYAQDGPPSAPGLPSPPIVIFSLHPHFSITKAAGLVGLGAGPRVVKPIPASVTDELSFDLDALEMRLKEEQAVGRGVIVNYGLGEVNTGGLGTDLDQVARLCKTYGAWLHIDAAFGGFAAALPEYRHLTKGIELADSLTLDGHKWLNVPYDCGLFYTKQSSHLSAVFAPPTAPAYLSSASSSSTLGTAEPGQVVHAEVPNPLYCNIENSRRFRALPLFASLISLGKEGYAEIFRRNNQFAQQIAQYIQDSPYYTLLNPSSPSQAPSSPSPTSPSPTPPLIPLNILLFSGSPGSPYPPSSPTSSTRLAEAINASRRIYVTGTKWRGGGAIRLAVSNHRTGTDPKHLEEVIRVLEGVARGYE